MESADQSSVDSLTVTNIPPSNSILDESNDKEPDSPSNVDNDDFLTIVPRPTVLGKLQAKKRLQAFSIAKTTYSSPLTKVAKLSKLTEVVEERYDEHGVKFEAVTVVKKPATKRASQLPAERAKETVEQIENMKEIILRQQLEHMAMRSKVASSMKDRSHDRSHHRYDRSPRYSLPNSAPPVLYPVSWDEARQFGKSIDDFAKMNKEKKESLVWRDSINMLDFHKLPMSFKKYMCKAVDGSDIGIPAQFLRITKNLPHIFYSGNTSVLDNCYFKRSEVLDVVSYSHRDSINSIISSKPSTVPEQPKITSRSWYSKIPFSAAVPECEVIESSSGLSILQNYVDVDEDSDTNKDVVVVTNKEPAKEIEHKSVTPVKKSAPKAGSKSKSSKTKKNLKSVKEKSVKRKKEKKQKEHHKSKKSALKEEKKKSKKSKKKADGDGLKNKQESETANFVEDFKLMKSRSPSVEKEIEKDTCTRPLHVEKVLKSDRNCRSYTPDITTEVEKKKSNKKFNVGKHLNKLQSKEARRDRERLSAIDAEMKSNKKNESKRKKKARKQKLIPDRKHSKDKSESTSTLHLDIENVMAPKNYTFSRRTNFDISKDILTSDRDKESPDKGKESNHKPSKSSSEKARSRSSEGREKSNEKKSDRIELGDDLLKLPRHRQLRKNEQERKGSKELEDERLEQFRNRSRSHSPESSHHKASDQTIEKFRQDDNHVNNVWNMSKLGKETPDTDEYHSNWESDEDVDKSSKKRKLDGWENEDVTPVVNCSRIYQPNSSLLSIGDLEMQRLEIERRNLSEERKKLEIEKRKIAEMERRLMYGNICKDDFNLELNLVHVKKEIINPEDITFSGYNEVKRSIETEIIPVAVKEERIDSEFDGVEHAATCDRTNMSPLNTLQDIPAQLESDSKPEHASTSLESWKSDTESFKPTVDRVLVDQLTPSYSQNIELNICTITPEPSTTRENKTAETVPIKNIIALEDILLPGENTPLKKSDILENEYEEFMKAVAPTSPNPSNNLDIVESTCSTIISTTNLQDSLSQTSSMSSEPLPVPSPLIDLNESRSTVPPEIAKECSNVDSTSSPKSGGAIDLLNRKPVSAKMQLKRPQLLETSVFDDSDESNSVGDNYNQLVRFKEEESINATDAVKEALVPEKELAKPEKEPVKEAEVEKKVVEEESPAAEKKRRSVSPRRREPSPKYKRRSPKISPTKCRKESPSRRRRWDSPPRRRHRDSPPRRRSSPRRGRYRDRRSRSPSPIRRRRSRSRSPERKGDIQTTLKRLAGMDTYETPSKPPPPINSPMDGLKRSLADSTISDEQLLRDQGHYGDYFKPVKSPKRLCDNNRIPVSFDSSKDAFRPNPMFSQNYSVYEQYNQFASNDNISTTTKVLQVGNLLQLVPSEEIPIKKEIPENNVQRILQVGNMLQIVPTPNPLSPIKQEPNVQQVVCKEEADPSTQVPLKPTLNDFSQHMKLLTSLLDPLKRIEQASQQHGFNQFELASEPHLSPSSGKEKQSAEELMKQNSAARLAEREKRRLERERRKVEKEKKHKEREKQQGTTVEEKTEDVIRKALLLEAEGEDENSARAEKQWPPPAINSSHTPTGKGILVNWRTRNLLDKLKDDGSHADRPKKEVQFADGVFPGEGTSPSAGELSSPTQCRKIMPKEKRFVKTKKTKKHKLPKKKVKVKVIRKIRNPVLDEEDEEDNLPPPSPPPGSPPIHLFPPRVKIKPKSKSSYATNPEQQGISNAMMPTTPSLPPLQLPLQSVTPPQAGTVLPMHGMQLLPPHQLQHQHPHQMQRALMQAPPPPPMAMVPPAHHQQPVHVALPHSLATPPPQPQPMFHQVPVQVPPPTHLPPPVVRQQMASFNPVLHRQLHQSSNVCSPQSQSPRSIGSAHHLSHHR